MMFLVFFLTWMAVMAVGFFAAFVLACVTTPCSMREGWQMLWESDNA